MPAKYSNVVFYSKYASVKCKKVQKFLDANKVLYSHLVYPEDKIKEVLDSVNSWYEDDENVADFPLVTYVEILASDDSGRSLITTPKFATSVETFPDDFIKLVVKK